MAKKVLIKIDKNGTKYWADYTCRRCGGQGGSDAWRYTGFTCYECGGAGVTSKPQTWKEYTPEYQAKLDERRAKKHAKELEKRKAEAATINAEFYARNGFSADGKTWAVLGDTYAIKDELKAAGCYFSGNLGWHADHDLEGYDTLALDCEQCFGKDEAGCFQYYNTNHEAYNAIKEENERRKAAENHSEYVGNVGDRIEVPVTIKSAYNFEVASYSRWGRTETHTIYTMLDKDGNVYVWKTSGWLGQEGEDVVIKGTVKEHSEYKGVKQTVLTRCKKGE